MFSGSAKRNPATNTTDTSWFSRRSRASLTAEIARADAKTAAESARITANLAATAPASATTASEAAQSVRATETPGVAATAASRFRGTGCAPANTPDVVQQQLDLEEADAAEQKLSHAARLTS